MTHKLAENRSLALTILSQLSRLILVAGVVSGACSSTSKPGGDAGEPAGRGGAAGAGGSVGGAGATAGGTAGAGGVAGTSAGGSGGYECEPPPTIFCAPTYDEQVARGCSGFGSTVYKGPCGSGWAWLCQRIEWTTCVFDQNKNLVRARHCDDVQLPRCVQCRHQSISCTCEESRDLAGDGGSICDINDVNRPPTGCADVSAGGGVDCCGDGKLPPSGPPFNCAPTLAEQTGTRCSSTTTCGDLHVVMDRGYGYAIQCGYDAQGTLRLARRQDDGSSPFCGKSSLVSASVGDLDGGTFSSQCGLQNQCPTDGGARD